MSTRPGTTSDNDFTFENINLELKYKVKKAVGGFRNNPIYLLLARGTL